MTVGTEPVVREVLIAASPETVFPFFTEPDKMTRWLCSEATVDPRPGGICHQTHPGSEKFADGPYYMQGEYVEVSPPSRVVFTWGFTDPALNNPPGTTTVEVTLEPENGGTRLRLVHSGLLEGVAEDVRAGWKRLLEQLAIVAAGGESAA
jgi:uncharacterized protein YndB with AHSA1/START domain